MKKIKGFLKGAAFLLAVIGLLMGSSTVVSAAPTTVTVSPANAAPGQQVTVTFTVNPSNADLHQIDFVVGFGAGATPNCNVVWVSPSACNFAQSGVTGAIPFGSVAIPPNGIITRTVTVPAGAISGSVFVGYTSNCGTVLFADFNNFCNTTDFWGTAPFTVNR